MLNHNHRGFDSGRLAKNETDKTYATIKVVSAPGSAKHWNLGKFTYRRFVRGNPFGLLYPTGAPITITGHESVSV
jgi:hypothetical protein